VQPRGLGLPGPVVFLASKESARVWECLEHAVIRRSIECRKPKYEHLSQRGPDAPKPRALLRTSVAVEVSMAFCAANCALRDRSRKVSVLNSDAAFAQHCIGEARRTPACFEASETLLTRRLTRQERVRFPLLSKQA